MSPLISRLSNVGEGGSPGSSYNLNLKKRKRKNKLLFSIVASTSSLNENSSVTFTVTADNISNGTTLYWTTNAVSGTVDASDFNDNSISGSFIINNNVGTITRTLNNDVKTESLESFQLQVRTNSISGPIIATSTTVTVNDTSIAPILSSTGGTKTLYDSFIYHTFTSSDTFVLSGGNAIIDYLVIGGGAGGGNDRVSNGGGGAGGYIESSTVLTPGTYTITIGAGGGLYGNGSNTVFDSITAFGGGTTGTNGGCGGGNGGIGSQGGNGGTQAEWDKSFCISSPTKSVCQATGGGGGGGGAGGNGSNGGTGTSGGVGRVSIIDGVTRATGGSTPATSGSSITPISGPSNTGNGGTGGFDSGGSGGSGVVIIRYNSGSSSGLTINSITPSTTSVNEGSSVTFTVLTSGIPDGVSLFWTTNAVSGTVDASDFTDQVTSGSVVINNNVGTITRTLKNDLITEGSESFQLQVRTNSISGPIAVTSSTITINDTSITPTITPSTTSVNEGSSVVFTVNTTNVVDGTTLYWTTNAVSGTVDASDFTDQVTSGSVVINNNVATITRTLTEDYTTEGSESFQLQVRTDSISGAIVATSSTITINDPTYSVTPSTTSANEGSSVIFTVNTTNINNGSTLYWTTNSGTVNASDFTDQVTSGSVVINNNVATITRTLSNDLSSLEGSESFQLEIRVGSVSGTIVATSTTVTVNDTSQGFSALGGTTYVSNGYKFHVFTSSDSLIIDGGSKAIDYLVIGGGAGGGNARASNGGGGAGGYIESSTVLGPGTYTITIGAGGGLYGNGSNTVFDSITAFGGGTTGTNGGCGGGNGGIGSQGGNGGIQDAWAKSFCPTSPEKSACHPSGGGGGGGGAGGNGSNGGTGTSGGVGRVSIIDGVTRATGGSTPATSGSSITPVNGSSNTGDGGTGGFNSGGSGGSGVVIIRYAI
jgi:hypothetical protein